MEKELEEKIKLQLDSLKKALVRLKEALEYENQSIPARLNIDATLQRFEFSFELAWKLMQSVIRYEGKDCYSPRDCFRTAAQIGLIDDPSRWIEYLDARNLTTHTYNQKTADTVYKAAKRFSKDTTKLVEAVKQSLE